MATGRQKTSACFKRKGQKETQEGYLWLLSIHCRLIFRVPFLTKFRNRREEKCPPLISAT